jgi:serine/threonine protein kinase
MIRELKVLQTQIPRLPLEQVQMKKEEITLQMPFLEHDLMGLLMARQRFSTDQIIFLFKEIVQQVYDLHSSGLIHRDIKSSNILLGKEALPSLIDFGHSISSKKIKLHPRCGTMIYLSPELLLAREQGQVPQNPTSGDMWALGCVLAELFLGRPLFWKCRSTETLKKAWEQLFGEDPLIKALRKSGSSGKGLSLNKSGPRLTLRSLLLRKCPDIPENVLHLLESLLNPDPKLRPSCGEVLGNLGNEGNDKQICLEIQKLLETIKVNCHEHEVRQRLIAKRNLQMTKGVKKDLGEIKRKPRIQIQEVKLEKRSKAPGSGLVSNLKKVKVRQYRESCTPIN